MHQRPVSPHLTIYRFQLPMVVSILHRGFGCVLAICCFLFAFAFEMFGRFYYVYEIQAWTFQVVDFVLTYSVIFYILAFLILLSFATHMSNGIRHLVWDTASALDIPSVYRGAYAVVINGVLLATLLLVLLFLSTT